MSIVNATAMTVAFRQFVRAGGGSLSFEQRNIVRDRMATASSEMRALSATVGPTGGVLIPQEHTSQFTEGLSRYSSVFEVADTTTLITDTGASLPFPTVNDTGNSGTIIDENTAADESVDPVFGLLSFGTFTYDSGIVLVPVDLLEDSEVDIEAMLFQLLTKRIGRAMNPHLTNGTGAPNQPAGLLPASTLGYTAAGQTAIAYSELIELEHSVNPEYRANATYMLHDTTLKAIRKLVDGGGRPLFVANGNGVQGGRIAGTLNGYPVSINPNMPTLGAGNKTILFGDMSQYKVRRLRDVLLLRMNEAYREKGLIGFRAILRADGALADAGTHPVKYLQQAS